MFLLGIDLGSSSVKAALVDATTGRSVATAQSPADVEMPIGAPHAGWAEQPPDLWWHHTVEAIRRVLVGFEKKEIRGIGISYQMHGLVTLDAAGQPVRPAIIWCDSRAVGIGNQAFVELGGDFCLSNYLNSPGNFTASKLRWVQQHEPVAYARIRHAMLPGDYLAYRLTGELGTTVSGLSEGILWDFKKEKIASDLLAHYGLGADVWPSVVPTFGQQGRLSAAAAAELGLSVGVPVTYRAGDQPNNALSLNVLEPGEVAATGGTSGVVYGVTDRVVYDPEQRVNSFAHVNHRADAPRIGILLCINGAGITHAWMRRLTRTESYAHMENLAAQAPIGADGLTVLPFGNGAERMLQNQQVGAQLLHLDWTRHASAHVVRAGLEGIAYAFVHGMRVLQGMGLDLSVIRVGNDNLFQSAIFSNTIATALGCRIELLRTNGATGAAIAAGVGAGVWQHVREGLGQVEVVHEVLPQTADQSAVQAGFARWEADLGQFLALKK
jgi:xylulokinase